MIKAGANSLGTSSGISIVKRWYFESFGANISRGKKWKTWKISL
jgi:hypothetical protein